MIGMIGEVRLFSGTYAPVNWALCQGQTLYIADYPDLFSIIGTTYGGNGRTKFRVPDLKGRAAVGQGGGLGLSNYSLGQKGGAETVTLSLNQLARHTHLVNANSATDSGSSNNPANNFPAVGMASGTGPAAQVINKNWAATSNTQMNAQMVSYDGGEGLAHENRQPSSVLNYVICLLGEVPQQV